MATQLSSGDQEKPKDEQWAKTLEHLVRILAGYGKLRFVPFYVLKKHGENEQTTPRRWRAVLGLEEIQYLPEDVDDPVREVGLGRAAHEVWHLLFSRPELIFDEAELSNSLAFQALWWAIEDPRVNWLGLQRHPGARPWLDAALKRDFARVDDFAEINRFRAETPIHIQFTHALIYEWFASKPDPRVADPRVRAALAQAYPAIRRAYFEPDAARSFAIVKNEVWPIYKQLVDEAYGDARRQEQAGQDGEEQESDSQPSGKPGKPGSKSKKQKAEEDADKRAKDKMRKAEKDFRDKHASKVVDSPEKMSQAEKERMKKEMEKLRKKMGQKQDGQKQEGQKQDGQASESDEEGDEAPGAQDAEARAQQRERLSKAEREKLTDVDSDFEEAQGTYEEYLKRVQQHVPIMKAHFLQVLKRKIRRRVIRSRDSGDFDSDALSRIPGGDRDVFKESMVANKTLYRISLLIDISGSMGGDKKERAIEGAVMLMESLDKLPGVQYEIVAFDDKPYVVKAYNERSTARVKAAAVKALLKNGGSTQSGLAVKEALERLRMGRGDKLMIMVNDGDPDNNFSKEEFQSMIRAAKDVDVHGVGLGPDAQLVLDLFPAGRGWWLKDPAEFARKLRTILSSKIK